ncbi:hypothetical protein [Nonomuraea sp. MG754425]|nr:hypothetical protein [Nonomuraea sp. MG754425]
MKVRVLAAIAVVALAGAPPILEHLGTGNTPLVHAETIVQHVNILTS